MALEVEVLAVSGAAEGAVLSVRAGGKRRQALASSVGQGGAAALRFPAGPGGLNPFRVDLLQPAGSARLALKPTEGVYTTTLRGVDGGGGPSVRVDFAVCEGGKAPSGRVRALESEACAAGPVQLKDDDLRLEPSAVAARKYLEHHELLPFVRALLQTVIRDRPADPFGFIEGQFRDASAALNAGDGRKPLPQEPRTEPPTAQSPAPSRAGPFGVEGCSANSGSAPDAGSCAVGVDAKGPDRGDDLQSLRRVLDSDARAISEALTVEELKQVQGRIHEAIHLKIGDGACAGAGAGPGGTGEGGAEPPGSAPGQRRAPGAPADEFDGVLEAHRLQMGQNLRALQDSILGWLMPTGADPGPASAPGELERALALRAEMAGKRDELAKKNAALKREVREHEGVLEGLLRERSALQEPPATDSST